ncbi:E3 ubiquitin-protein ligase Rnf220 isoform X4 [Cryptotermes secundus]|uniref:E3 ubiquitin-protein ligase Rnf220 isoform X4 n=1 Tax=Cryptotermes secundus TaxID=105785 RepID=UPI000CD7D955|nr:E3 ubiquitin-protein ligase Rnf220 isoform X4 [Cryptotermes secundus]
MENSAYVPNPLPPPALVVFSQAGGLPDALRMQRPFNPQAPEAKDLHVPFNAGLGLRHMDNYPGLPAHLLHHIQPQFFHPALDPRVPFGSGAFRPLGTSAAPEVKGFPSAFAPPSKCLKIETSNSSHHETSTATNHLSTLFSPGIAAEERAYLNGQTQQQRADSSSPASVSISPPVVKEESSDAPMSEDREGTATPGSEGTERSTPEEGRGFRRKKKFQSDPSCCPVCGVTVRPGELEAHFVQELERLYKLNSSSRVRRHSLENSRPPLPPGPTSSSGPRREGFGSAGDGTPEGRWDTYQRIKANRQGRLRIKNRKRKADEATCPVCNERVQGSVEELNSHVEMCLRKHGATADEDENVDVEGDSEMYEEYEWAGQRRIRATTLLVGGFAAAGMATSSSRPSPVEEEADLVVDGDDSTTYGPPQYSEADVVMTSADGPREEREREALREAIISPDGGKPVSQNKANATEVEVKEEPMSLTTSSQQLSDVAETTSSDNTGSAAGVGSDVQTRNQVLEALKTRIRELETETRAVGDKFKCLICMERYKKPVISVCCWHVHCEECWLHTLGAKKLCPQCNMITSPSDLRRIYM